jgi:hypothetical protein
VALPRIESDFDVSGELNCSGHRAAFQKAIQRCSAWCTRGLLQVVLQVVLQVRTNYVVLRYEPKRTMVSRDSEVVTGQSQLCTTREAMTLYVLAFDAALQ